MTPAAKETREHDARVLLLWILSQAMRAEKEAHDGSGEMCRAAVVSVFWLCVHGFPTYYAASLVPLIELREVIARNGEWSVYRMLDAWKWFAIGCDNEANHVWSLVDWPAIGLEQKTLGRVFGESPLGVARWYRSRELRRMYAEDSMLKKLAPSAGVRACVSEWLMEGKGNS